MSTSPLPPPIPFHTHSTCTFTQTHPPPTTTHPSPPHTDMHNIHIPTYMCMHLNTHACMCVTEREGQVYVHFCRFDDIYLVQFWPQVSWTVQKRSSLASSFVDLFRKGASTSSQFLLITLGFFSTFFFFFAEAVVAESVVVIKKLLQMRVSNILYCGDPVVSHSLCEHQRLLFFTYCGTPGRLSNRKREINSSEVITEPVLRGLTIQGKCAMYIL